ncbi:MAG: lamin tail domain-containing protein [Ignavibacteriae bacterium]|nr:lamin tail domain-containing protein [Ignavibacteriota bacterium]
MKPLTSLLAFIVVVASGIPTTTSLAQVVNFPYVQNFDSVQPPALPVGWGSTQNKSPGTNDFITAATTPRSLPYAVGSTNATITQSLISPLFDFRGLMPDSLFFYVRRSTTHNARLLVEASLDNGQTFPLRLSDSLRNTLPNSYQQIKLPLPASLAVSPSVRFRWRILADSTGTTATLRIDDVTIGARRPDDLELSEILFRQPPPVAGDSIIAIAKIRNVGQQSAFNFGAEFYLDANRDSLPQPSELRGTVQGLSSLSVGDSVQLSANIGALAASTHQIIGKVIFPPDQHLANNQRIVSLVVGFPAHSVVVNEIMYAPSGSEPEWVELFNTRTDSIDLRNWLISDNLVSSKKVITAQSVLIPPLGFVVLTRDSVALVESYPEIPSRVIGVTSFPSFNNTGDAVVVYDNRSATIDSAAYLPAWGGSNGSSLERIDALGPATDSTNWITSTDSLRATPGRKNSQVILDYDVRVVRLSSDTITPGTTANIRVDVQNVGRLQSGPFELVLFNDANGDSVGAQPEIVHRQSVSHALARRESIAVMLLWSQPPSGIHRLIVRAEYGPDQRTSNNVGFGVLRVGYAERTLVINEVMYAPFSESAEYVELYNASPTDIDLAQWKIRDRLVSGSSNEFKLCSATRMLHPGEYFVLASDSSLRRTFPPVDARLCTIVSQSSLSFNNDGDDVVLIDAAGLVIDSVRYAPAWHNPNVIDKSGRSLEKINPLLPSNGARNWTTCALSVGGTPGHQNSVYTSTMPAQARLVISPNPFSPDGDGREDFTIIQYEVPLTVSMIRARVFDAIGREIRTLVNNEASGSRGSIVWDGMDDDKQKARVGIYIVLLEAIDDRGGVIETAKGAVVVAARL